MTEWEWKPITVDTEWYMIGAERYIYNYCFPGPTFLYSPFDKYPDNPISALIEIYGTLTTIYAAARYGLEFNRQVLDGNISLASMEDLRALTTKAALQDLRALHKQ